MAIRPKDVEAAIAVTHRVLADAASELIRTRIVCARICYATERAIAARDHNQHELGYRAPDLGGEA